MVGMSRLRLLLLLEGKESLDLALFPVAFKVEVAVKTSAIKFHPLLTIPCCSGGTAAEAVGDLSESDSLG